MSLTRYERAERLERMYRELRRNHKLSSWAWQKLAKQVLRNLKFENKQARAQ